MSVCKLYTCVYCTLTDACPSPRAIENMLHRSQTFYVLNVCCQSWRFFWQSSTQELVLRPTRDKELGTNTTHFIYIVQEKEWQGYGSGRGGNNLRPIWKIYWGELGRYQLHKLGGGGLREVANLAKTIVDRPYTFTLCKKEGFVAKLNFNHVGMRLFLHVAYFLLPW